MLSWSTFQTTTIYDEVLRQVCAMFGIETFQEQQKAIDKFFCLCFVTNWLWKILNISSSASDRSPLLSRTTSHYIYRANKLSVSLLKVLRSY